MTVRLAKASGISNQMISAILSGSRRPSLLNAAVLEDTTKINRVDWLYGDYETLRSLVSDWAKAASAAPTVPGAHDAPANQNGITSADTTAEGQAA